tara:strand:- start:252 stop:779 length:528 start_codon:yes stop_codon:yes gene_type:complete
MDLYLRFWFVLLAVGLVGAPSFARELIVMEKSIEIQRSIEDVYEFAGNALNDGSWRKEVNEIRMDGPFNVGTIFYEDAKLGSHDHFITYTEITEMNEHEVIYETTLDNPSYLKSHRIFEAIDSETTRFTYHVEVEEKMFKDILKLPVPKFLAKWAYKRRMKKYLKSLRDQLEVHL